MKGKDIILLETEVKGSNKSSKNKEVSHATATKMFMDEASTSKRVREEVSLFTEGDGAGTVKDCKTAMACFFIQILPSQKH